MDNNTKCLQILLCYDFVNNVTNEKEDVLLATELDLFTINTITLSKLEILATMVANAKIGINAKIDTNAKISTNPKIDIDMKL